jgi:glycosyltransferase involved in cell wall biosynthesis
MVYKLHNMTKLTIHTATYNRAYILSKAYESLKAQTVKDFEWIISDDGSTDNTEELVTSWINSYNDFPIRYFKLPHVGIPRALNNGVKQSMTEWFMMLDSDDHIKPNTVEKVLCWLDEIKSDPSFGGIGFMRCFPNGEYMKPQKPIISSQIGYLDITHLERAKYNLNMDSCEVHRTDLFRKYPFQYWETERYAPEQLPFYEIAFAGYKMRWRDEKLYICDYLPDGQTKDNKLVKNNPMGFAMMYNQDIKRHSKFADKCYSAMQMTALAFYGKNLSYLRLSNNQFITCLMFPLGIALGIRRCIQFAKLK